MKDMCVYEVQIRGQVDEAEVNALSPLQMVRTGGNRGMTQFTVHTDQSGLIGLLRHLHNLGFVFLLIQGEYEVLEDIGEQI